MAALTLSGDAFSAPKTLIPTTDATARINETIPIGFLFFVKSVFSYLVL